MKREDLKKLELSDEAIDRIMALHGKDIESFKTTAETAKAEADGLKEQLAEANKQIDSFKGMDIDGVKKAAADWEAKAKQAEKDAAAKITQLRYDYALDTALAGAKVKNPKAVKALLNGEGLKYDETANAIVGLDDQLTKIRETDAYLFTDDKTPVIVKGGNNQPINADAMTTALRKGAGLSTS